MITEDYVSLETAKLLKEKGFDVPCRSNYRSKYQCDKVPFYHNTPKDFNGKEYEGLNSEWFSTPTLQMAMKWLREKHNKYIDFTTTDNGKGLSWQYEIVEGTSPFKEYIKASKKTEYLTYEECAEKAIKYCLEHLI